MSDREKLIYLAGIIDGEGTIGIYKGDGRYHIHLEVGNTNKKLIDWLEANFGCRGYPGSPLTTNHKIWKEQMRWRCSGKNAYRVLKEDHEFLLLKEEQADLAIKLYEKVNKWHFHPLPLWAIQLGGDLYQQCKKLNQRGIIEGKGK